MAAATSRGPRSVTASFPSPGRFCGGRIISSLNHGVRRLLSLGCYTRRDDPLHEILALCRVRIRARGHSGRGGDPAIDPSAACFGGNRDVARALLRRIGGSNPARSPDRRALHSGRRDERQRSSSRRNGDERGHRAPRSRCGPGSPSPGSRRWGQTPRARRQAAETGLEAPLRRPD